MQPHGSVSAPQYLIRDKAGPKASLDVWPSNPEMLKQEFEPCGWSWRLQWDIRRLCRGWAHTHTHTRVAGEKFKMSPATYGAGKELKAALDHDLTLHNVDWVQMKQQHHSSWWKKTPAENGSQCGSAPARQVHRVQPNPAMLKHQKWMKWTDQTCRTHLIISRVTQRPTRMRACLYHRVSCAGAGAPRNCSIDCSKSQSGRLRRGATIYVRQSTVGELNGGMATSS